MFKISFTVCCCIVIITTAFSCKHKPPIEPAITTNSYGNFPTAVGKIIANRCATAGCHNTQSYENAAGLLLDSWEHLFDGSNSGAVVIPYNIENSSLLFFINPDSALGPKAQPLMPLNAEPLTIDEYKTIRDWIAQGAPNEQGDIPFTENGATRNKIYFTNQGCDLVGVIDAEKRIVMRYIKVGKDNGIEAPHYIRVSSNGYAYVSFLNGHYLQKIDTRSDTVIADVQVGVGSWNVFHISPDGKKLLLGDFSGAGRLLLINTESMQIERTFGGLFMPHGITSDSLFEVFYVTSQLGNTVYRINLNSEVRRISIDGNPSNILPTRNPHEILMAPDYSKYFLTCDKSSEVRIMSTASDSVIDSIDVGIFPQEMAISKTKPYLFITCTEDNSLTAGFRGSIYVIDYNTHKVIKRIDGPFYQPHGISVDDVNGLVYIFNRNVNSNGPAPHHSSSCNGRNGYYTIYDLNTLQKLPRRFEVSVDPYSSDIRFK